MIKFSPSFRLYSMSMWMYSTHHLVSFLSMMLLAIFHCMMKVCFLQNSGSSIWAKSKLRHFMMVLMIAFTRAGSMIHQASLGILFSLCARKMVNCVWSLIIKLSMHRPFLISILFLALTIFWILSIAILTLLALIYSPGIIRLWWQMRITIKRCFLCCYLYKYNVMPLGLTNAPETFQKLINSVFGEFLGKFLGVYLDDVLVSSKCLENHVHHLRLVLD